MDQQLFYLNGKDPCVLLYKWKNELHHDVFRIKLVETHEIKDVSPRSLHLWPADKGASKRLIKQE